MEILIPWPFNGFVSGFESFGWIVMFLGGRKLVLQAVQDCMEGAMSASRRLNLRACCSAAGGIPQAANGKATLSGYSRLADLPAGRTVEARQLRDGYPGELITRKYIVAVTLPAWLLSRVPSAGLRLPRYGCGCGDCRSRGIPIQIRPEGSCPPLCI